MRERDQKEVLGWPCPVWVGHTARALVRFWNLLGAGEWPLGLPGQARPYIRGSRRLTVRFSTLRGLQTGCRLAVEQGLHRTLQIVQDRPTLLRASGQHGPDPLAPTLPSGAARALCDVPVNHHEADRLLGQVVGRFHAGCGHEPEIAIAILLQPPG